MFMFMYMDLYFQYIAPDCLPIVFEDIPRPPGHRDAVVNAFVYVHQTLHQANNRLAKRGGRSMAVTPRHYLDFINHYVRYSKFYRFTCENTDYILKK